MGGKNRAEGKPRSFRRGTGVPARGTSWAGCPCHGTPRRGPSPLPLCAFAPLRYSPFPLSQVPTPPRVRRHDAPQCLIFETSSPQRTRRTRRLKRSAGSSLCDLGELCGSLFRPGTTLIRRLRRTSTSRDGTERAVLSAANHVPAPRAGASPRRLRCAP
jgi:hypothetical protein